MNSRVLGYSSTCCVAVTMSFQEEESLGKVYDSRLMARLLTYLSPYKLAVAAAFLLILVISSLKLVGPYLIKIAIDEYIARGDLSRSQPDRRPLRSRPPR